MNHKNNRIWLLLMAVIAAALPHTAQGSLPVKYAMVGCIEGDKFYINEKVSSSLVGSLIKTLDGKTIRIEGLLFPGDRFEATALFIVEEGCREDLQKTYFLCDPCQTLPSGPPSREVPRKESGVAVQVPREAIKQFDNLPRLMRPVR